jgi:hypothetical protein
MKSCIPIRRLPARFAATCHHENDNIDQPFDVPDSAEPFDEPEDSSDLEDLDFGDDDDARWDVFIPDDEYDPEPDPSDFWHDEFPNDD